MREINILDIIEKKRDGNKLSKEEIEFFVEGVSKETIPDYQISALLMAIFIKGMDNDETKELTLAMANSGEVLNLSKINGIKVDKHSTGGVADTTTLVLLPLIAAVGIPVVKMSGRGLGFTGGTLDKLESIKGFNIEISDEDVIKFANNSNVVLMGQSENLTPADKKLYALRDVTRTVDNMPLIASSIMSKKIAAGSDAIVLDVKCGSGAFMKNIELAKELAEIMVAIGKGIGRDVIAIITDMNQPLGNYIGNSLEVIEACEILKGNVKGDLLEVVLELGANMLILSGKVEEVSIGKELLLKTIESGEGINKFKELIEQQGGDSRICDDYTLLGEAKYKKEIVSNIKGYITRMECEVIGNASVSLGAGRLKKSDLIDYNAGIIMKKRIGDFVNIGETIFEVFANDEEKLNIGVNMLKNSYDINTNKCDKLDLIKEIVR